MHVLWLFLEAVVLALDCLVLLCLYVVWQTHAGRRRPARKAATRKTKTKLVVFLGSGGHTGEMIRLLDSVDFERYAPRFYLVSSGDTLSLAKISKLEDARCKDATAPPQWSVAEIPRARRVHQSFLTAPFTTLQSFFACIREITLPCVFNPQNAGDLILLNGPGSCVPIAIAAFLPRIIGLHSPQIIYIESMARVKRLSLSGKILRLLVDRFFVQWEAMADQQQGSHRWWLAKKEYRGLLV